MGRVTTNFGSGRGAIAGCHWCAMVGAREGEGQLWRSGRGAGAVRGVTTNFGGVDVVSLLRYGSGG